MNYPDPIKNLIDNFASLPGIGQKTAERLVFYLLKKGEQEKMIEFGRVLANIKKITPPCPECGNLSENGRCNICSDRKRDKTTLCIVAEAQDIFYLDKTGVYNGIYHVLGGLLSTADGITIKDINTEKIMGRILRQHVREVVMGINPTVEGESTIIYLKKTLREKFPKIKITRLSRGLPMGGDLEYADEITLSSAIKNRSEI